jgi:predicted Zn-dependent peptidase
MTSRRLLPAVAMLLAGSAARAATPPPASPVELAAMAPGELRESIPGGPELVVIPVAGAGRASLRVVVRAGSAMDPVGKEGLAHLVEHAIVEGPEGRDSMLDEAMAGGATVQAFTSRDSTRYVLDARSPLFWRLGERLLRAITDPRLRRTDVEHHLGVIESESAQVADSAEAARSVEAMIFGVPEATPLGLRASRLRISREDVVAWFQRNYVSSGVTVIFTGDVDLAQARALLKRAFLLPPALPEEAVAPRPGTPLRQREQRVPAPFVAVVHGYRLLPEERGSCAQLAEAVWLRMYVQLSVREPLLSPVEVQCASLRGVDFILAFGFTLQLDAPDLPERVAAIFRDAGRSPLSASERTLLDQRLRAKGALLRSDPPALADELAKGAAAASGGSTPRMTAVAPIAPAALLRVAARAFTPERRVSLVFTPFEQ